MLPLTYFIELVRDVMLHGARDLGGADRGGRGRPPGAPSDSSPPCASSAGSRASASALAFERYGALVSNVQTEPAIAFALGRTSRRASRSGSTSACIAGREATSAEIDELGKELLARVREVSIIREERHEIADTLRGPAASGAGGGRRRTTYRTASTSSTSFAAACSRSRSAGRRPASPSATSTSTTL